MEEVAVVNLIDVNNNIDGKLTYYFKRDEDFNIKIEALKDLLKTFDNFQEVEDFIVENFEEVILDEYILNY